MGDVLAQEECSNEVVGGASLPTVRSQSERVHSTDPVKRESERERERERESEFVRGDIHI